MNKVALLLFLVLLAGGAGAFAFFSGDDTPQLATLDMEPPPGGPQVEPGGDPGAVEPLAGAAADPGAPGKGKAGSEEEALPEGLSEVTREELRNESAAARALVVQVWDGKPGVPAADTDVYFLGGSNGSGRRDSFAPHWSELAESKGQRFKTGADGRVELPAVEGRAIVTAQRAGAYGCKRLGRRHRDVESITLQPDETVTIRVIGAVGDGQERPASDGPGSRAPGSDAPVAGVPVGVVQSVPVREFTAQNLWVAMKELERAAARTKQLAAANPAQADRAAARLRMIRQRQVQLKVAMRDAKAKLVRNKKKSARAATAAKKQRQFTVSLRSELRVRRRTDAQGLAVIRHFQIYRRAAQKWWSPEHTDRFEAVLLMPLRVPAGREFAGRPVPEEPVELRLPPTGSLELRTVDLDGRPFLHPVHADLRVHGMASPPWARLRVRKEQNRSSIVFPFVGLGLEFTAACRLDDDDFRWNLPPFTGPNRPGERRVVDLVVAPGDGMLSGRIVDAAGQPLAGIRSTFLVSSSAGRLEGEDVTTGPEGRFHLPYKVRSYHRPPFRLEIRRNGERPVAGLAMPLPRLPVGRVTDLGDLALDAFRAIAHGLVTDDRGVPVAGATLQLQRERDGGGPRPKRSFHDEAFVVARTDAEGRYRLFGELEPGRYRLVVRARDHFPVETRDLRPGGLLDVELLRRAKVVGTVRTPDFLSSRELRVVLQSSVDAKQRRSDRVHDYKGAKYVYFDWVRPGVYDVLIRLTGFPDPILRIDGVAIEPGQTGVHPRLRDLDLASMLHRFELTAVDGNGAPVRPDWPLVAGVVRPSGQTSYLGFKWKKHRLQIVSAAPRLEIWPAASGYRAERAVLGPGANEVRFLKIPPLDVQLSGFRRVVGDAMVWIAVRATDPKASPVAGLPGRLEKWDGLSGKMSGWFADKQRRRGGAMLGAGDTVRIRSMSDGELAVTAWLLATGKKRAAGAVPVKLGNVHVRLVPGSGPQRVTVAFDPERVAAGLAELRRRESAAAAKRR